MLVDPLSFTAVLLIEIAGGVVTAMDRAFVAVLTGTELSLTITVKFAVPAPRGVPLSTPAALNVVFPGNAPPLTDHA
jgi:hypothetical protein